MQLDDRFANYLGYFEEQRLDLCDHMGKMFFEKASKINDKTPQQIDKPTSILYN